MSTILLIVLSVACIIAVIFYSGALLAVFIEHRQGLIFGIVLMLVFLVFAALY